MNGYQRRTEANKQRILGAAIELFQQYGINRVTIRDIADQAGVSHVTVYKHFGDQNDIIRQIIKTQALSILEKLRQIVSSQIPLEEKINYLVFQRAELAGQSKQQLLRIIFGDAQLKEFFISVWQKEISNIEMELLDEGIRTGYVNNAVSKETIRLYLEIIREGLLSENNRFQFDNKIVRELHYLILHGLLKK
jgi:AcrR family transcriptional regulator